MSVEKDDLAVVTGPLQLSSGTPNQGVPAGEVVRVMKGPDIAGDVYVYGRDSQIVQYIAASSLTPLSEIQDDPDIEWGAIHDYVHVEDD